MNTNQKDSKEKKTPASHQNQSSQKDHGSKRKESNFSDTNTTLEDEEKKDFSKEQSNSKMHSDGKNLKQDTKDNSHNLKQSGKKSAM